MPITLVRRPKSRARRHAVQDPFHHSRRVEAVGLGHEPRAEAELDVVDPLLPGVRHALVRDAAACLHVHQHGGHPPEARDEGHQGLGHLDVGPQALHAPRRQRDAVPAAQVEDGLETHAAVEVAVKVDERQRGIDSGPGHSSRAFTAFS